MSVAAAEDQAASAPAYRAELSTGKGPGAETDEAFGRPPFEAAPDAAWNPLFATLGRIEPAELRRRWERARLLIADHGVTYRAWGDRVGDERPWALDPIPLLIGADAWAMLEAGLLQRARLLEAVLADLHGPRRLVVEGVLPAPLLLGNPGFFRPLSGLRPAGGRWLSLVATDLGRDEAGRWCVLGDRTAAPAGVGHALEHRVVVSRTLPAAFRRSRVRGLGAWFERVRRHAGSLSPRPGEPRVVLLSPGPAAAGHAEHAYLARSLGFALIEPADLTVRGEQVFLKTLGGLDRVDVVVRRTPDADGDPLEIDGAAPGGGVPGLLQAERAGNVAVTNAPGSGLVESPGFAAYLADACELLLGEPLQLPVAGSRWGGAGGPPADPDGWFLRAAHAKPATPGAGPAAGEAQRSATVRDRPDALCWQRSLPLSTTPAWDAAEPHGPGVRLVPRGIVLRTFTAAVDGGHAVMPGGLGRVAAAAGSRLTSMRSGGEAKDVWVVAQPDAAAAVEGGAGPAADRAPAASAEPAVRGVYAGGREAAARRLPGRVADNLFWLGRYAERAEGTVRLLRAIGHRCDGPAETHPRELAALLRALAEVTGVAGVAGPGDAAAPGVSAVAEAPEPAAADVVAALFDPTGPHALVATLAACRQAGRLVRDRLSVDAWRILERLGRDFDHRRLPSAQTDPEDALSDAVELFDGMLLTLAAFAGHGHESFTHEEGWRFLDLGRRIERAVFTAELTAALLVRPVWAAASPGATRGNASEGLLLEALLEVGVSAMTYRSRHPALPRIVPALELLLLDGSNPRALRWQLDAIANHVDGLPDGGERLHAAGADRSLHASLAAVRVAHASELSALEGGRRPALDALLGGVIRGLPELSNGLARAYVRLVPATL